MTWQKSLRPAHKDAFSFTEVVLAAMILGLISVYIFTMIFESSRGTSNAYHQYLAEQIAREPLEVFRFIGCQKVLEHVGQQLADYRFNEWQKVEAHSKSTGIERPDEVTGFERKIMVTPITHADSKALLIQVIVRPRRGSLAFGSGIEQLSRSTIIVSQR